MECKSLDSLIGGISIQFIQTHGLAKYSKEPLGVRSFMITNMTVSLLDLG